MLVSVRAILILLVPLFVGCARSEPSREEPATSATTVKMPPDKAVAVPADAFATWIVFRPEGGRLKVLLPSHPVGISLGSDEHIFSLRASNETEYAVSWTELPAAKEDGGPERALKSIRDSQVEVLNVQLLKDVEREFDGHPAREVVSIDPEGDVIHRFSVIADGRLYQLIYLAPKERYSADDEALTTFLSSFELLD